MQTFYDGFRECAERWPHNVALEIQRRDGTESYTYAETRRMAESIARWLGENGFNRGARCAILADNHPRWVAAYLGIIAAGCTAVPLDTALHPAQAGKLLNDSASSLLFCDAKHAVTARTSVEDLPVGMVLIDPAGLQDESAPGRWIAELDSIFTAGPGNFSAANVPEDAVASLLYTSGTTDDPKGVMLTHGNLLGEVEAVFGWAQLGPRDTILGVLPLFHVLSQMANLLLPLVKGLRVVYLETLNTTELTRALRERNVTVFAAVPQFFYLIHERIFKEAAKQGRIGRYALRAMMAFTRYARRFGLNPGNIFFRRIHMTFGNRMRYLVTGGSPFDAQIARDFHDLGIDVLQAYGLTETTGGAFATRPNDNVIGSVGPPLPGVEGKILDPQSQEDGDPAAGEVAIRGAIVMKGYWNRPDATAAVLKDGWLHTGDLGYFDERGNLFITGRKKDVIILSNGKNIYPEEIEPHYLKSPYIREICVMGLKGGRGDPLSDRLHAVIVPNFDVLKARRIVNIKEVIRFDIEGLSAKLPTTKRVLSYEIWQDPLPRTTTQKLKRFEIEKRVKQAKARIAEVDFRVQQPLSTEDKAWIAQPQVQRALKIIRGRSKTNAEFIRPTDNLELDLGLDSMQRVELLAALEEDLGGDVEESQLADIYTVRDLIDSISHGAAAKGSSRPQMPGWKTVLQEESADPEVVALGQPSRAAEMLWYVLSRLLHLFANDRFQLKVKGVEKVPANGPYILCSNHQSYIDPFLISCVLPWQVFRDLFAVGTSEIFGSGFMRKLASWLRIVVVDPDANLIPAMRAGAFVLRHGRILILFPEGERSIDGTPKIFKKGAAILSIHTQVPIVPLAIEGFHDAWPRGRRFQKFAPLRIAFGDPIYPPVETEASEAAYEELTARVKADVTRMWQGLRRAVENH
jgi:long-chain acyl-CoA synthetase